MNEGMVRLLIDADKNDVLREQVLKDPAGVATLYDLEADDVAQCFDSKVAMMADMVESKGSSILLITTSQ